MSRHAGAILSLLVILSPLTSLHAQQTDSVGVKLPSSALGDTAAFRPHLLHVDEE